MCKRYISDSSKYSCLLANMPDKKKSINSKTSMLLVQLVFVNHIVREPAIGLIKWLRPKGLKVCYYVEKSAKFKNHTLKKSAGTQVR